MEANPGAMEAHPSARRFTLQQEGSSLILEPNGSMLTLGAMETYLSDTLQLWGFHLES
jgi:hypothetical protein